MSFHFFTACNYYLSIYYLENWTIVVLEDKNPVKKLIIMVFTFRNTGILSLPRSAKNQKDFLPHNMDFS